MNEKRKALLGIDIGTSSCTAIILDMQGMVLARAEEKYPIYTPEPGWAEQNPADWWSAVIKTSRACVEQLAAKPYELISIGIDSHLEAFVPIDARGEALANGMLWLDDRTVPQAEELKNLFSEAWILETTGVPINHINPAAKFLWFKQKRPEIYHKTKVFLSPKDYAIFMMTGHAGVDYSIASKTMLYSLHERCWSPEICRKIGIDMDKLPPIKGGWEIAGYTTADFTRQTGIKEGTPVASGGGDDHCQAFGVGVIKPGIITIGSGTGSCWQTMITSPQPDPDGKWECHQNILPETWIYWSVINSTGFSVGWFINNFGLDKEPGGGFARFEALAAETPAGSDGLFYYPHLWGTRTPRFNPKARGVFFGMTNTHHTGHFCRAILEGIAFQYLSLLEWLSRLGVRREMLTMVGGETHNRLWNQIKADVVGQDIYIPEIEVAAAVGAAMLGSLAVGAYSTPAEASANIVRYTQHYQPRTDFVEKYARIYQRYRAVYDTIEPAYSV